MVEEKFIPDTLTSLFTSYHQVVGETPAEVTSRFALPLKTKGEQAYGPRKQEVGTDWTPLDFGWLSGKPISHLCIENKEGYFKQRLPSEEQKAEAATKIIEICSIAVIDNPKIEDAGRYALLVHPTASHQGWFADPSLLRIRCLGGTAKYTITVLPG